MNKRTLIMTVLLAAGLFLAGCQAEVKKTPKAFSWPQGCKAAVSLTFDDAIYEQAVNAAPLLKKYGFKGTFFLSGGRWAYPGRITPWKTAYADGNELGAHTLYHPCQKFKQMDTVSENYTLEKMRDELKTQIRLFKDREVYRGEMVFAYPCGVTWVGNDMQSYEPVVEELFAAGRGYTDSFETPMNDPLTVDLYNVQAANLEGKTAQYFITQLEEAKKTGKWVVFAFHGIGGGWIITETKEFEGLLKYLNENRETIWTAPFGEAAGYVKANR